MVYKSFRCIGEFDVDILNGYFGLRMNGDNVLDLVKGCVYFFGVFDVNLDVNFWVC